MGLPSGGRAAAAADRVGQTETSDSGEKRQGRSSEQANESGQHV